MKLSQTSAVITAALSLNTPVNAEAITHNMKEPNIIFFMTDDQGWGDLGHYGHPHLKTPAIDRFASQSLTFTDFHAPSAVCSPSRAGLLTGRTPYRNGMYGIYMHGRETPYLRTSEKTLPSILKENGYATCHVGKWHLGVLNRDHGHPSPSEHGYDYWMATDNNAHPSHINPGNFIRNAEPTGVIDGNSSQIIVDEAIEWISDKKPKQNPFFLTVWTHEPHTPIGTAPKFRELYPESLPEKVRDYYGNISQIDAAFGSLINYLENSGQLENTIILYTSDNGSAWDPDHLDRVAESNGWLRGAKAWMYEGGIRVPGILHWPGKTEAGEISREPVIATDLFPTILDYLDIPLPNDRIIDGTSLLPHLDNNESLDRKVPLYWRYDGVDNHLPIAFRDGDWILLADDQIDYCELYNLSEDWQQRNNLVYDEFDKFAEMKKRLVAFHKSVEADGPDWWRKEPDPLLHWKQNSTIGITRHLQGVIPEPREFPFSTKNESEGGVRE